MKSIEWIDRLIKEKKLPSDRQAALMMGMTVATMSGHRVGRSVTLDDKYAYRLEILLNVPHGTIVMDQHAEREKDPAVRSMWQTMGKLAAQTVAGVALAVCALTIGGKPTAANENSYYSNTYHTMRYAPLSLAMRRLLAKLRNMLSRSYNIWNSKNFLSLPA